MNKTKAIFIDSEGTLRNTKHQIDDLTKEMIQKLVDINIHVIITTGLPRFMAKKICLKSGASKYIICSNGADIYNLNNNSIISSEFLNSETLKEIYDLSSEKYNIILGVGNYEYSNYTNMYSKDSKIVNDYSIFENEKFYQCHISQKEFNPIKDNFQLEINQFLLENDIDILSKFLKKDLISKLFENKFNLNNLSFQELSIIIRAIRFLKLLKLKEYLLSKYSDLSIGNQSFDFEKFQYDTEIPWFSLNKKGVSKGNALLKMCEYFGIDPDEVIAIGNDYNDRSMIDMCGHFMCPTNSLEIIKNQSNIEYNCDDGLGKVLVKIYDGNK